VAGRRPAAGGRAGVSFSRKTAAMPVCRRGPIQVDPDTHCRGRAVAPAPALAA